VTRATVGLLFSDIEGSTRLLQQLGPAYAGVLLEHRRLLRSAFGAHEGHEMGTEGDSFFVTFPTASDAVAAALSGQLALAAHQWPTGASVRVRIGVHVGEVEQLGDSVVGLAVHEAARISAAAHGRQILASDTAARLASPLPTGAAWQDLGQHRLKDIAAPVHMFQLLHDELPAHFPPVRSHGAVRNNLPSQPSSFVGRGREVAEVQRLLAESRVVTVTGTGGAGKSRIALRVAAEEGVNFGDGVWFVDLAPVSDPAGVAAQVAEALGLPDLSISELCDALEPRRLLLLVDNCEHVISSVGDIVSELLRRCASVSVLATSREPLGIQGEVVWRVPPLDRDDAIELLTVRARAVNSHFAVTQHNRAAVDVVCERLDAIPLALELAAARLTGLSVEQLASRLDQRFRLLAGGARGAMERHRTLQATVDWSYDLLSAEEQAVLRRLGVFVGGFTLEAAEATCGDGEPLAVFDLVDRLVVKSLVVAEDRDGGVRYRLLETVRQYALDRLVRAEEVVEARDAHLRWATDLVAQAESVLWFGGDEVTWLTRLDMEDGNVRAALEWALERAELSRAASIVWGLFSWLTARGRAREGLEWSQRLLAAGVVGEDLALMTLGELFYASNTGPIDADMVARARLRSPELAGTSRAWLTPLADAYCAAWSYLPGDATAAAQAVPACEQAVEAVRGYGPATLTATLQPLLWVNLDAGNVDAARQVADEGLAAATEAGLSHFESRMALNRARIALACDDLDSAWRYAERAVTLSRATGETFVVTAATQLLSQVAESRGEFSTARDLLASIFDDVADSQSADEVAAFRARLDRFAELAGTAT
jgi:predicted ATPase/class 3 adenylate cyclase